jgi:hypothetical protein
VETAGIQRNRLSFLRVPVGSGGRFVRFGVSSANLHQFDVNVLTCKSELTEGEGDDESESEGEGDGEGESEGEGAGEGESESEGEGEGDGDGESEDEGDVF